MKSKNWEQTYAGEINSLDYQWHQKLCGRAQEKAKNNFTMRGRARQYMSLFTELVNR